MLHLDCPHEAVGEYCTCPDYRTDGICGRTWDDAIITSMTPAPSGRCPFEYFHDSEDIPDDWPVQPIELDGRRQ